MDNYKLLEKHRKKLSVYFSIFVLFSLWITQWFFLAWIFFTNNIDLQNKLYSKYDWVIKIISNIENYTSQFNDPTIKIILEKTLEWVTIFKNWERILWEINDYNLWKNDEILDSQSNKYLQKNFIFQEDKYNIIIKSKNPYSYKILISQYISFILFTIALFIIIYLILYKYIWINLKPIRESIDSLETFSWNINHEMKTPITEIISTLSLTKETKLNYEDAIAKSLDSAKKLNKILDWIMWIINLVDYSYKKQKINIIKQLDQIINEYKKQLDEKNIELKLNIKDKQFYLFTNPDHFNICIWNIIQNAIKYSNQDWIIEINFLAWIIEIIDNWIWIEGKNLSNIFNKYFRECYTQNDWYWLWLALVKRIVDLNNWKIDILSEKNVWTKVILNLNLNKWKI